MCQVDWDGDAVVADGLSCLDWLCGYVQADVVIFGIELCVQVAAFCLVATGQVAIAPGILPLLPGKIALAAFPEVFLPAEYDRREGAGVKVSLPKCQFPFFFVQASF